MIGTAIAPGTCGELVQGTINNINFLITCPINCYSKVTIELNNDDNLFINEPGRYKILNAVHKTMMYLVKKKLGGEIIVNSQLPVSKGMASSTADIAAAILATAKALGFNLTPREIANIALSIEPSDGIFFSGIVAFDHVNGSFFKKIGNAIDLEFLIFDLGGEVDTIAFNSRPDLSQKNKEKEPLIKQAMSLVEKGFETNNPYLIGEGATLSALANQTILLKPDLEKIVDLVIKNGAFGINIAHSGTLIGVLLNTKKVDCEYLINLMTKKTFNLDFMGIYKLVNGGVTILEEEKNYNKDKDIAVI